MILHFKSEEHKWLSNMYLCPVELDGVTFPSAEHAYVYFKTTSDELREKCKDVANNPHKLKVEAKKVPTVADWKTIRLGFMERIIEAKFKQQPLRDMLIATGNENIQEGNWWNDTFYGVDLKVSPNVGENHLGRLIMKTRDKLNAGLL